MEHLSQLKRSAFAQMLNTVCRTYMNEVREQTPLPITKKQRNLFRRFHSHTLQSKLLDTIDFFNGVSETRPLPEESELQKTICSVFLAWSTFTHSSDTHMEVLQRFIFQELERIASYYDVIQD